MDRAPACRLRKVSRGLSAARYRAKSTAASAAPAPTGPAASRGRPGVSRGASTRSVCAELAGEAVLVLMPAEKPVVAQLRAQLPSILRADSVSDLKDAERGSVVAMVVTHAGETGPGSASEVMAAIPRLPKLRWIHTMSAGVDHIDCAALAAAGTITLTHNQGISDTSLAEWALLGCLRFAYEEPRMIKQRAQRKWDGFTTRTLRGKTMGVVGVGSIGCTLLQMAVTGFGMTGLGLRRESMALPAALHGLPHPSSVRMLQPGDAGLAELLGASDFVVLCLPETADTVQLIGDAELKLMKPGAVLVNIGRGSAVDCTALAAALADPPDIDPAAHHGGGGGSVGASLRGAALEVAEVEPLPQDHPLWDVPDERLLLSPHTADFNEHYWSDCVTAWLGNLARLRDGADLLYKVDLSVGY